MSKLTVARALTAQMGRRFIRIATIVAASTYAVVFVITALLVYFFSPWWWLLLLPATILLSIFFVIRLLAKLIVGRIHTEVLTVQQHQALNSFIEKIEQLIEARATPPIIFVLILMKDIVLHRDITTIKKLISDSASLRHDYRGLEKLF